MTAAARPSGEARVWAVRQTPPWGEGQLLSLLDAEERTKAASFIHQRDRSAYLAAHAGLRLLLGDRLGIHPREIRFGRDRCAHCGGPHGRPVLLNGSGGLHFSLSHCAGLTLIGVAGAPLGVDAERLPSRRTVELCLPRLHPRERDELLRMPPAEWALWFCRLWTRKEAYLKALGTGLGRGLDRDYLGAGGAGRPAGWTVANLSCGPQNGTHAAALAVPAGVLGPTGLCELNWSAHEHVLGGADSLEKGSRVDMPTVCH
ncbi:4'-phosphopantetheinyl transferase family protein [Streptomyces sp. DSM 40907]|uniref:4'-phosphopantetheinyl transferase family protein n=1 Tax=Streptomyces kutzneri TaxID=3051179 RepID=UPI0028D068FE|nr:4'-phosphopantetheinyl transferase superfamily protein [Streptomyces sp. DSM 40907]